MGHITYPNVATVKEGQIVKDVCWRGRYLTAPADTPPGEGYKLAKFDTPNREQVLWAVEQLVPESSTPTDRVMYEIRDTDAPEEAIGESKDFAYILAEISRWRRLKLGEFPDDVWCTGIIGIEDGKPFLCSVRGPGFDKKLQGFLSDQNQDTLFLVPSTNIRNDHKVLLQEQNIDEVSVEQLKEGTIDQPPVRKTIVKVRGDKLPALVELLFDPPHELKQDIGPNPYRGLRFFREEDADLFFGRDTYIDKLVEAVQSKPFVAVIGASGSGKSSLVYAGLIPRLRAQGNWLIAALRPAHDPFYALADALMSLLNSGMDVVDRMLQTRKLVEHFKNGSLNVPDALKTVHDNYPQSRILLFIDQFEELYTLCGDAKERRRFLDELLSILPISPSPQPPISSFVLTMRADFVSKALAYRPFVDVLQQAILMLGPMNREELRAAIEQPAARQEVKVEEGLTDRMLDAVKEEPGHLPLLQFAVTELWNGQTNRTLTHAAYEEIGGVEGALMNYAEREYVKLTPDEQLRVQRIFTQLVRPGEGTEDTKRIATRAEIGEEDWPLVVRLASARLVVTNRSANFNLPDHKQTEVCTPEETVDVAHEALIRGWQRLREWIDADREFRMWQERLRSAMRQWQASNYDEGALLRGALLAEAEHWQHERTLVQQQEQQFIQTSLDLRDREQREREARQQRELELARKAVREEQQRVKIQTQARKRLRNWLVIATLLAIVAIGASFGAYWGFRQAVYQSRVSMIRALVAYSLQEDAQANRRTALRARPTFTMNKHFLRNVGDYVSGIIFRTFQKDAQASRERAALLAHLARILNKHFNGDEDKQIEDALRNIFRTETITKGYGHDATGAALDKLVCQSVNFKKALTPDEWKQFLGDEWKRFVDEDIVRKSVCPDEAESPDAPPLHLRSEEMTTSDKLALSLNLREDVRGWVVPNQYVGNYFKNYLKEQGRELADDRFDDQGEGVILDKATGLMWEQSGSPRGLTYEAAKDYIDQLNEEELGGYDDWRLPTIEELLSLVEEEWAERTFFELTEGSFEALRDDIPGDVLERLQSLERKRFYAEKNFLDAITQHMGEEQPDNYTALILAHARDKDRLFIDPIFDHRQGWCWSVDKRQIKGEG